MTEIVKIPITSLTPPLTDVRFSTDFEADRELVESIKSLGVLLPLLVRRHGKKYEIIAGHRRYKASIQAALPMVPCVILAASDIDSEKIKLHENLHRLPLGHVEQGLTFQNLRDNFSLSELEISILVGKSVPFISQHLSLIRADPALVKDVNDGKISFSVARELLKCSHDEDLDYLREWSGRDGSSVDVVRSWVTEANARRSISPDPSPPSGPPPTPPPSSVPTFICQACDQTLPIRELTAVRLCAGCNQAIFTAIREEREKTLETSTGGGQ